MATKRDFLKMVRLFCSECMGGPRASKGIWPVSNVSDIADCTAPECIWFTYRFGRDPDKRVLSPKQKEQVAKMRAKLLYTQQDKGE